MSEVEYLTQEKFEELKLELEKLKTSGRQEVAKKLKQAKELGDLRENSEYEQAREEQRWLESRIKYLESVLANAVIIKKTENSQTVRIGSKVKVKKIDDNKDLEFIIVGSNESDPLKGKISNESPLGRGLLGKKVNDIVKIRTPQKEVEYKILKIE